MDTTEEDICGETIELIFGDVKKLNLELVKVTMGDDFHYEVHFADWSKKKTKTFFKMHIKDAIELKSAIDRFVIDIIDDQNSINKEINRKEERK